MRAPRLRPAGDRGPAACSDVVPPAAFERLAPAVPRGAGRRDARRSTSTRRDGTATYWVQIAPLRDDIGRIIGGMALSRDITARRAAERALEERARELERSNAELEQFAYVASHDLSEPLRMVSSYLQLLRRRYHGRLDADADEFIDFAVDGAARMRRPDRRPAHLLARRPRRRGRSSRSTARAVVERVADGLRGRDGARAADVVLGDLPRCMGDAQQLGQLFQNLIGNAVKFVPDGPRRRASRSTAERDGAQLALHGRRQRHRDRAGARRAHLPHVPAPAHARRVPRHRHRPGDRQEGRRAPRRHDLGRAAPRRRRALPLHAARPPRPAVTAPRDPARGGQRRRRPPDARGAARGRGRRRADRGRRRRAGARLPAQRGRARRRRRPDLILLDLNLPEEERPRGARGDQGATRSCAARR